MSGATNTASLNYNYLLILRGLAPQIKLSNRANE